MEEAKIEISKKEYTQLITNLDNYKKGLLASKKREKKLNEQIKKIKSILKD